MKRTVTYRGTYIIVVTLILSVLSGLFDLAGPSLLFGWVLDKGSAGRT